MSGSVTVGIDIGTTSVKAVSVDGDGRVLARTRVAHRLLSPEPDLLEHDAAQAWRRGPTRALAEVTRTGPAPAAVCVASMVPSLTAVDRRGRPCAPGLLYGDGRGRPPAPPTTDGRAEVSNVMPDAVGFLRWAVDAHPGAAGYWPAQAVADFALGGVPAIDTAMAMSLGDLMQAGKWDQSVLDEIGVREDQLPVVVPMATAAGSLPGSDTVLAAGTVDALCDQIVSGADHTGDVLVICGATLVVWAVVDHWVEVPGLWTVPHFSGKVLVGGPSNAGALFADWARTLLGRGPRLGRARPAPGHDLLDPERVPVWLPYVRGERAPYHDVNLRSALHDLDITHGPAAAERAAFEASGFVVRNLLQRAAVSATRIVASGGGTQSSLWMQALADATGLAVDTCSVPEGAALGAAFVARVAAGLDSEIVDAARWASTGARYEPDERWRRAGDRRFARFMELSPP